MRIVLNSDVLHMSRPLSSGLANHIGRFCREAHESGGIVVLPRTVLLENERHQREVRTKIISELTSAGVLLGQFGIQVPPFEAGELVAEIGLADAIHETGVRVEIEDATIDDFRDAERRACLHLPPQSRNAESDEMRDLVIWAVALRIARRDGTGMIISRDSVHSGEHGVEEARQAGLLRAKSFDDALDLLGRESPLGAHVQSVLIVIWSNLREAGLPLPEQVPPRRFTDVQFTADPEGYSNTQLAFEIGQVTGQANIAQKGPGEVQADLTNLIVEGRAWKSGSLTLNVRGELPRITSPASERIGDLRALIEGNQ